MWMFQFCTKKLASTDLEGSTQEHKKSAQEIKLQRREGTLTSYCAIDINVLKKYATNEQISTADPVITSYKQPARMMPTAYGKTLWTKMYRR